MIHNNYKIEEYRGMAILYSCPGCGRENSFRRFVYKITGQLVGDEVGYCLEEKACGYNYNPLKYFADNNLRPTPRGSSAGPSFIPENYFLKSLCGYDKNSFVIYLKKQFGEIVANEAIEKYRIGTSKKWEGATVFWQIDSTGKKRNGRIISCNFSTGSTIKITIPQVTIVNELLKLSAFNAVSCFFGEHLLCEK
jgi:hypothetical protein